MPEPTPEQIDAAARTIARARLTPTVESWEIARTPLDSTHRATRTAVDHALHAIADQLRDDRDGETDRDQTRGLLERLAVAAERYLTRDPDSSEAEARVLRRILCEETRIAWEWLRPDAAAPPASATTLAEPAPAGGRDTGGAHSGSQGRPAWAPPKDLIGRLQLLAGDLVDTVARLAEHGLPDSGREHLRRYAIASREAISAAGYDAERTVTWAIRRHSRATTFVDQADSEREAHRWAALWPAHSGGYAAEVLRQETVTTMVATFPPPEPEPECTCPDIDITTISEEPGSSTIKGHDPACPQHGRRQP